VNESQRARALRLITALEHANPYNYERAAAALLRELAAEPVAAPRGDEPTMPINVVIDVPTNWESRLDMQWIIEREIKADRWSWRWPSAEPERVPLTDQQINSIDKVLQHVDFWRVVEFTRAVERAHGIVGGGK